MPTRLEQLVVEAARLDPDSLAVTDRDDAWTYQELHDCSTRVSSCFARIGLRPTDRVAVWAPKSCRVVAVFQAALRVGAAYVPIELGTPSSRAQSILDDCDVTVVVTTRALGATLPPGRQQLVLDEMERWTGFHDPQPPPFMESGKDDLAYILYTSGSTGTPKGVCISHRNALAFVTWAAGAVGITGRQVFACHASFTFDLSVFDLYAGFLTRGLVSLIPESVAYSASELVDFIRANRISIWYSVPSVLVLMMEHGGLLEGDSPSPAAVIFAGEPFPIRYLRRLRERWPRARMFNFYGPTETNVCTSYEVVDIPADQTTSVPIGSAASGNRVWAVTDDGAVATTGEKGELHVEGPTVMMGYWGRGRHSGPYRTGDICVLRPDGHYDYMGRRDQMIKRRGHRVELAEIEAVLSQHPNVREVAVAVTGEGLDQRLVAFVVPIGRVPTLLDLKGFGARRLPRYMLVDYVRELDTLPRTPNGKIDRLVLHHGLAPLSNQTHD